MTRNDLSFLIEKAIGMWLIVIGLDWLPELVERWIGGIGAEDTAPRLLALRTFVPLAAGAFILLRRGKATSTSSEPSSARPSMGPKDWLWVALKVLGAYAIFVGGSALAYAWTFAEREPLSTRLQIGQVLHGALWSLGGITLCFHDGIWRVVCRSSPAAA